VQLLRGGKLALAPEHTVSPRFTSLKALVVVEVALALVLVAGAAVFVRSFQNLRAVPTGFSTQRVTVVHLSSTEHPGDLRAPFHEALALAESLRRAPLVEAAAVADLLTFDDSRIMFPVGVPGGTEVQPRNSNLLKIDGAYFETLRIPLMTGRTFTIHDDDNASRVVVLSEGTARRLFPGENPLGRRMLLGNVLHPKPENEVQIVGIVNDIKFSLVTAPAPDVIFQPLLQGQHNGATTSTLKVHVRSRMSSQEVAALVRTQIAELHLPVSVDSAAPLQDAISASMVDDRTRMQASGLFGILALLLITAGTYGLMAYSVAMRTREIGIRMVVGSRPPEIVRLVLRQSLSLVLTGVLVGLPGAAAAMRAVSSLVFGLSPIDWTSLVVAALLLWATAILASVVPAWRAAHLDPMKALRVQ
jgi:predicted permease